MIVEPVSPSILLTPVIQYGFAGFCIALLAIQVWVIKRILDDWKDTAEQLTELQRQTNEVVLNNTKVMQELIGHCGAIVHTQGEIKEIVAINQDMLLSRPCIAKLKVN